MLTTSSWRTSFYGLDGIPDMVSDVLSRQVHYISVGKDTVIFGPDNPAEDLLLLTCGTVRVQQRSKAGHEVMLYRVHAGERSVLNSACLLAFEDYLSQGIAETDVDAILIPRETLDDLMESSPQFRGFVFEAYSKRITDLFTAIDESAVRQNNTCANQRLFGRQDAQTLQNMTRH
ncbi:Crp/Fnr family transcriptional regulator [uncultured Sulfitobacter sp.]|uniref:Crp/Fnr family transcriptional regulator n=1 Tax=uncultured Sulfitobacter sp. TaxID=191468 RepID=UPI00260AF3AA|nr:Crp/Fnr family transcriptional regulator [uncultured Sulfitobacter sp.]